MHVVYYTLYLAEYTLKLYSTSFNVSLKHKYILTTMLLSYIQIYQLIT